MGLGAAYDAVFAAAILFALRPAASLLRLDVPDEPVYLRLCAVLLFMLAAMYAAAARDPVRHVVVVQVAGWGRIAGFVLLTWTGARRGVPTYVLLGLADLAFGVVHLALLARARRLAGRASGA